MTKLLIKNGHVVDPDSGQDDVLDVLIEDGRIAALDRAIEATDAEVKDASGLIVAPGFIDIHVHLREPGIEHAETIESGARAAAAGGFTSVCCMPNTIPVNDSPTVTSFIVERARRKAIVNVFPIGAVTKGSQGEQLAEIGAMKKAGAVAVSDDGLPVMNSGVMRRAMQYASSFDMTVIDHCEDLNLSLGGDIHEGHQATRLGLGGIPSSAEDVMVARNAILSESTGARCHIAHISTRNSIAIVRQARQLGIPITCEVSPHHFTLVDTDIPGYDSNYKMRPPLRTDQDIEAAIEGLADGVIDAIATDHAPHTGNMKAQEFERCPFGVTGLETSVGLSLERLVVPGTISLMRMVELFTTGPASVIGGLMQGTLRKGAEADITILDLNRAWTFDVSESKSKSKNSPFDRREFKGGPVETIVHGRTVWSAEKGCINLTE
ncbi:MAG: dihydroorotase [Solibacterales bacterium]|nr:dihydroorotase [Bryobacterales bacterium]|tara:strand:+ start:6035 stop:7342 length:1308 start_codon:yes stop_codon:yes gene_type:complete